MAYSGVPNLNTCGKQSDIKQHKKFNILLVAKRALWVLRRYVGSKGGQRPSIGLLLVLCALEAFPIGSLS